MEVLCPMQPSEENLHFLPVCYWRSSKGAEQFWWEAFWRSDLLFSIGFPWLWKHRKEDWIDVCLIPSQMICVRKWLTAGRFLCLLCPSFCLLLTRHLPVRANGCVPSHASHLAAGSFLLLRNLKAMFAEVLRAVSSQCLGKCLCAALLKTRVAAPAWESINKDNKKWWHSFPFLLKCCNWCSLVN